MLTINKRSPVFADTDLMWFGKYINLPIQDVPATYLQWWYGEVRNWMEPLSKTNTIPSSKDGEAKLKLYNYIRNNMDALQMEIQFKTYD